MYGDSGDDTLIGGSGNDTLTGGLGADVFKWSLGDVGTVGTPTIDTIKDFKPGQGDSLDLRDLLDLNGAATGTGWTDTNSNYSALATVLKGYVQINDTGSSLQLTIDTNGLGTTDGASTSNQGKVQTIVLEGVRASNFDSSITSAGLLTDTQVQSVLQKMLTDGNLKHD